MSEYTCKKKIEVNNVLVRGTFAESKHAFSPVQKLFLGFAVFVFVVEYI